jgi:hypothetical protein
MADLGLTGNEGAPSAGSVAALLRVSRICVNPFSLSQIWLSRMAKQKRTKAKKRRGRPVTTGRGTLIGIRCHKEFLTRVDAWRAGQAGELSRPAAIHRLAELWLDTAGRETKRGFAD